MRRVIYRYFSTRLRFFDMAFVAPSLDHILANILRDIRNLQSEADVGVDSDHYVRSAAVAAAIEGLYQKLAWLYRQIFPDTADEEELLHAAAIRGLRLKEPVAASGTATVKGIEGVELLHGATLKHVVTGEVFSAASSVAIGADGKGVVTLTAQTLGRSLNGLDGNLIITSPPLGMDASAFFVGKTSGGEDREKPESLLARLLELIQRPPAGGADYDYKRWAKEVDGIADALVLPRRRGAGTVDVVVIGSDGAPSPQAIENCQAHIEQQCSVIADVWVFAPLIMTVDSTATVELAKGYLLADVQAAAQLAYDALVGRLAPREMLKRSHIEAMINNLPGVVDRALITPVANVQASDAPESIGWIRPGVINLELMT